MELIFEIRGAGPCDLHGSRHVKELLANVQEAVALRFDDCPMQTRLVRIH
jgi:hypothetical protein